ncbi:MAG: hypothetical protein KGL95_03090, partial [Patescibacteria group bacterium]|nr:hypothetical protein [Patescibacteria group bacterium]
NIDTSVQQWFKNHEDPVKEKIVREKQDVLVDVLDGKTPNNGLLAQSLPWSIIGYDYSDNALEVGIIPQDFTPSAMSQYFKEIRSVVGDQIDIALSPQDSPHLTSCTGFRVACTPMEGAIQIEDTSTLMWGSIMYPAKYNNQYGFVTAGHYVNHGDSIEQPVGGSTVGTGVGTEWFNGTNCDCSFSSNSTDISGQIKGYSTTISATASPFGGMSVTMCGAGTQGCSSGSVVSTNVSVKYSPSNYVVNHLIESSYSAMDGDSGGPVVSGSDLVGDQSGKNSLNTFASPVGLIASDFSGLTWCFGC